MIYTSQFQKHQQTLRDSNTFQTNLNGTKSSQILKNSTTSHMMSPINNIRDLQNQYLGIGSTPLLTQQNSKLMSNYPNDQQPFLLNDQQQNQIYPKLSNSVSQYSVGNTSNINKNFNNMNINYQVPIMKQDQMSYPQNTLKNSQLSSINNSNLQIGRSQVFDKNSTPIKSSINIGYNSIHEEQSKQITHLTQEIVNLTNKLQRIEKSKGKIRNKKNDSDSSSDNSRYSRSSSRSNDSKGGKGKRNKSKQERKKQDEEIKELMDLYLKYVNEDKFQLNLFRDNFFSEKCYSKLKETKNYKQLFLKTLNVLIQNIEKNKVFILQSSSILQQQAHKNTITKNGSNLTVTSSIVNQQLPLSHVSSTAQLNSTQQNGTYQNTPKNVNPNTLNPNFLNPNISNIALSPSSNIYQKLSANSHVNKQNDELQGELRKSQIVQQTLQKNIHAPLQMQQLREQKIIQNMDLNQAKNYETLQSDRVYQNQDEYRENIDQNYTGNYYAPKSVNGINQNQSPSHYRGGNINSSPVNHSPTYQQDINSNGSNNNNIRYQQQKQQGVSNNQYQKTFSFMPRESQQSNINTQNYQENTQNRENKNYQYVSNGNNLNGNGIINNQLTQSRESFGVHVKSTQQQNINQLPNSNSNNPNTRYSNKRNNLQLEDIPDEAEPNNKYYNSNNKPNNASYNQQNNVSGRLKYQQNDFNEKMKQQAQQMYDNDEDDDNMSQQPKRTSHNSKKTPQSNNQSTSYSHTQAENSLSKYPVIQQFNAPKNNGNQRNNDQYDDSFSDFSESQQPQSKSKKRQEKGKRQKPSTMNEIGDFDNNSVHSKSSRSHIPNEDEGRQRVQTTNSQRKSQIGLENRTRGSFVGRLSSQKEGKNVEQPPTEPCHHPQCTRDHLCIHHYANQSQLKERESYFFKTKERNEKIIPDITQISKKAKPTIQVQKTEFDIITNNTQGSNTNIQ